MTATDAQPLVCPTCGSTQTAIGGSGNAICTECTHMWNPADPAPITTSLATAAAHDDWDGLTLLQAAGNPETAADILSELEGGIATLEGGQVATVVTFKWPDSVVVELSTGDLQIVPLADVQRIMPPVVVPEPVDVPDTVDAMPPDMQLAFELAKVIVRAGAESVEGTGANVTPGMPPVGYLPADPELLPVIERAAGLAVGMLIEAFELDVDEILVFAGAVATETETATETTEVASESDASNDE